MIVPIVFSTLFGESCEGPVWMLVSRILPALIAGVMALIGGLHILRHQRFGRAIVGAVCATALLITWGIICYEDNGSKYLPVLIICTALGVLDVLIVWSSKSDFTGHTPSISS